MLFSKAAAKVLLFFECAKFFAKKMHFWCIFLCISRKSSNFVGLL
jgi:hypothetical protein